jgi:hypothetical protein
MNWVKHPIYNIFVNEEGTVKGPSGKLRKPRVDRYGYLRINISIGNYKNKTVTIHRLVADCFKLSGEGNTVDHIDGNKSNNHVSNLQLVTAGENSSLSFKRGDRVQCHSLEVNGQCFYSKREAARVLNIDRNKL